jgi:hypothetical protein
MLTAVPVDFKSAYEPVLKANLLLKLVRSGIRYNLLQWLQSFISHTVRKFRYGECYSEYHILQTGLPKGAVISCTLFNLCINGQFSELNSIPGIKCLLYANDLVFWTEVDKIKAEEKREQTLSKALAILEEWCERNNTNVNTSKQLFSPPQLTQQYTKG